MKPLSFFSLVLLLFGSVSAHWTKINGLNGGRVIQLSGDGKSFFAVTDKTVYTLASLDSRWEPINFEIEEGIKRIWASEQAIFAASDTNVFLSENGGDSWKKIFSDNYLASKAVTSGKNILLLLDGRICVSRDDGASWRSSQGSRTLSEKLIDIVVDDSLVVVIDKNNICRSLNHGLTWKKIGHPADAKSLSVVAVKNGLILVGCEFGLYSSSNMGLTWKCSYAFKKNGNDHLLTDIAIGDDYQLIATSDGIFSSSNGQKWKAADSGFTGAEHLVISGDTVLAGGPNGIFVSPDRGVTWGEFSLGLESTEISALASDNGHVFAGTPTGNIYLFAPDSGWKKIKKTRVSACQRGITALFARDSIIFAGSKTGLLYSTSSGLRWGKKNLQAAGFFPLAFSESDSEVFLGGKNGIYLSVIGKRELIKTDSADDAAELSDDQKNIPLTCNRKGWEKIDSGIEQRQVLGLLYNHAKLFAGTDSGFFSSTDQGKTWEKRSYRAGLRNLKVTRMNVLLAIQDSNNCLMASGDGGISWIPIRNPPEVTCLAVEKGIVFAGAARGVFYSFNSGNDWINFSNGLLKEMQITSLTITENNIFCGTNGNGVWQRSLTEMKGMAMPDKKGHWPNSLAIKNTGQKMKVDFSISKGDDVALILYAVRGEKTISSIERYFSAGNYANPAEISSLKIGVYLCQMKTGRGILKIKRFFLNK